jgi:hypothetical protein
MGQLTLSFDMQCHVSSCPVSIHVATLVLSEAAVAVAAAARKQIYSR